MNAPSVFQAGLDLKDSLYHLFYLHLKMALKLKKYVKE